MNDAEDGVGADEIPRPNRVATIVGVADQSLRVNRSDAAISQWRGRSPALHLGLVDVDAFFVLAGGARRRGEGSAGASCKTIARGFRGRVVISRISHVIVDARIGRASAGNDPDQAGKGIRSLCGAGGDVVDASLAECRQSRAKGYAIIDGADALGAVHEINRVHTVDADEQNVFDATLQEVAVVGGGCGALR